MFNSPKESESLLTIKSMRWDYSIKLNIAFLIYQILTIASDAVIIYEVNINGFSGESMLVAFIALKSIFIIM